MRKLAIITGCVTLLTLAISCSDKRRSPGRAYMPDMAYSRAYETYGSLDTAAFTSERNDWGSKEHTKIFYNSRPVAGTMARGDMAPYNNPHDSMGYAQSAAVKNPLDPATIDMKEAERLYLVNCGICHGSDLKGNGPLYKDGNGPYPAKPATLVGDAKYEAMSEGTMFHSVTYGINAMGSYASQLSTKQRWMVIAYVKSKQGGGAKAAADTTAKAAVDTMATAVKAK